MPTKALERLPVILISGFLSSGKTTLLNQLLRQYPNSAVIINEFGATGIDQQLLREHQAPLSTLVGGCLCCQVLGSLTPLLKNLRMAWEAGQCNFERVIIETSGVANPEPVLDTLLRQPWLAARYQLHHIITTVSATTGIEQLERYPEAQAQLAFADTVVITHSDIASAEMLAALTETVRRLAPTATQLTAVQGAVDFKSFMQTAPLYRLRRAMEPSELPAHGFNTATIQFPEPLQWPAAHKILADFIVAHAKQVVRLKGLLYIEDQAEPMLVQAAAGVLYPATSLPVRASDDGIGRLVIITEGEAGDLVAALERQLLDLGVTVSTE